MRSLIVCMMALLVLAPLAAAQEEEKTNETPGERPDDAAWVDDCPPDMMCAYDAGDEPSKAPADGEESCADEGCVYKGEPGQALGPEGCIECSQAPTRGPADGSCEYCRGNEVDDANGSTCMDGAQEGEVCDDDVQYFGPGPADTGVVSAPETEAQSDAKSTVPSAGVLLVGVALALAVFVAARRG